MPSKDARSASPSRPKFTAVKNTYEIIDKRVKTLSADVNCRKNKICLNYLNKMEKMRKRVMKLLKTYPNYAPDPEKVESWNIEISKEMEEKMQKLSIPPRRFLKAALIQMNEMIRNILNDHQYYKNKYKLKRVYDLLRYRKQICCQISKYAESPPLSRQCHRFAKCSLKPVPIYAVYNQVEEEDVHKKFRSRVLKFEFDRETNELSIPSYRHITSAMMFYSNLCNRFINQMQLSKDKTEKARINRVVCDLIERVKILAALKQESELRMEQKGIKINHCVSEENCKTLKKYSGKFQDVSGKICYGLPTGERMRRALENLKELQTKISLEREMSEFL